MLEHQGLRVLSLNVWGGKRFDELMTFIQRQSPQVDIFCFQELVSDKRVVSGGQRITVDLRAEVACRLPEFMEFFVPTQTGRDGLGMYVRSLPGMPVLEAGHWFIYRWRDALEEEDWRSAPRALQYIRLGQGDTFLTIAHLHGHWNGGPKRDTPARLAQSDRIIEFLQACPGPVVLGGDFNLNPDTASLQMLEAEGLDNLILQYGITSTRSSWYERPDKFADYLLVRGVTVQDFQVLPDEVSDHLALSALLV